MRYSHTQVGTVIIAGMVTVCVFAVAALAAFPENAGMLALVVLVVVGAMLALFSFLTVEIEGDTITCKFGVGLVRKRIALADIESAKAVRNHWLVGWGIRWVPGHYWVWNVSGLDAVELAMKDGSRFRIGTDEPEVLARALQTALQTSL